MARSPVQFGGGVVALQPVASPVDTYVRPQRSSLFDLAEGLSKIDAPLRTFIDERSKKQAEEDRLRGEAAFYNDTQGELADAVRQGRVPAHYSPGFVNGFKKAQGDVRGNKLFMDFNSAFDAWDGKNSEDPAEFDTFLRDYLTANVGDSEDPRVLGSLLPHVRSLTDYATRKYVEYRHVQTYTGSLEANVAAANQTIEVGNSEGLARPEGTDYARVFDGINQRRAEFISGGGRPQDFDKAMTDALSVKILSTRDPGLLGWFDQKVPGEDYTFGETAYGAAVKQNTIEQLEVVVRRHEADAYTKQTREDKVREEAAKRGVIELLASDPSAQVPDGLIAELEKYDGTARVKVEEWRRALGTGFSDPSAIKEVYRAIMEPGANPMRIVTNAASQGVFGRPEDLNAAYSFAKGFEDNKDRMEEVLGSTTARNVLNTLDVRTKGVDSVGQPVAGLSDEGLEAQYDFRRMVMEWVANNPDATLFDTEKQIAEIGKFILENVAQPQIFEPGVYERPGTLPADNPFAPPAAQASASEPATSAPQATPKAVTPLDDVADFLADMEPGQRQALEAEAARKGMTVEQLMEVILPGQSPGAAPAEQPASGRAPTMEPDRERALDEFLNGPPLPPREGVDPTTTNSIEQSANEIATAILADYTPGSAKMTPEKAAAFLDAALSEEPLDLGGADGKATPIEGDATAGRLSLLIGKHEAGGNYNAVFGNAGNKQDLSQFTLDGILSRQASGRRRGVASTAVGKYQIIYKTLRGLKQELGLTGSEKFTPKLQDRLFMALLERRGYSAYKAGRLSKRQFALRLSQEWASLSSPGTGRSYYDGDGLNRSSVGTSQVYAAMGLN